MRGPIHDLTRRVPPVALRSTTTGDDANRSRSFGGVVGRSDPDLPKAFGDLCELMERHKAAMPRRIRQAATFVIGHPEEVALQPLATVAARAGTHASVFVRLAQGIGFSGYSQMQDLARRRLVSKDRAAATRGAQDSLSTLALEAARSIENLDERTDRTALRQAADTLAAAHTIFVVGRDRAQFAALGVGHVLTALGIRSMAACGAPSAPNGTLAFASRADAALLIDVHPPDPHLVAQAAELRGRGVPLVLLTDSRMHPTAHPDVVWIEALRDSGSGLVRWGALECLAMALAAEVKSRRSAVEGHVDVGAELPRTPRVGRGWSGHV